MSDYLPIEIVQQVLLRLPIKSLLRCSSTCKSWYNLITSPDFISHHLDFTKSLPDSTNMLVEYFIKEPRRRMKMVLYSDDDAGTFDEHVNFEFPDVGFTHLRHVGCCNGLICLVNISSRLCLEPRDHVVLWNPMIRRFMHVPRSDSVSLEICTFRFLFDHIGNDYKVVMIQRSLDRKISPMVEVFQLSTGLWEQVSDQPPFDSFCGGRPVLVDLKGIYHWIGKEHECEWKIISFDAYEEVFGSIELPVVVVNDDEVYGQCGEKYLLVFEESLFLIRLVNPGVVGHDDKCKFDIWRMGEYNVVESWNRLHSWEFDKSGSVIPLGFRKNSEIVWVAEMGKNVKLISTNLEDDSVDYLGICENATYFSSSLGYVGSLVLLDKGLPSGV